MVVVGSPNLGLFLLLNTMPAFILGEKREQSQVYTESGNRIPTTFIRTSSCHVVNIKSKPTYNHFAIQMGFGAVKNIKKSKQGILKKAGITAPLRFLKEFRLETFGDGVKYIEEENKKGVQIKDVKLFVGSAIDPTILFKKGDKVTVSGTTKGKGFQGVVRRHSFKGGPKTHGQSDRERAPGSIGQTTTPGRIFKGKRMAGRMGNIRVTIKNVEVVDVTNEGITVKGAVPGAKAGLLEIKKLTD